MVSRPRSTLKALGQPNLFALALELTFPRPTKVKKDGASELAIPISNADLVKLIGKRLGLSQRQQQTLKIQIGRYRKAADIPDRRMIGVLSAGLGVPPMVLMIYAGRFEEFFGYVNALAALTSAPTDWPLKRSSPRRAAFALLFSTFPTLEGPIQSEVARQATTADSMFMHGPGRLGYHVGQVDDRASDDPFATYLAGSTTDGAFILPSRPSFRDLEISRTDDNSDGVIIIALGGEQKAPLPEGVTDYEFIMRSECQVDVSSEIATWIFKNIKPTLATTDMLRRAVTALNDAAYPTFERFGLAGYISAQWTRKTDSTLADEVLSNLWRWDQKHLTRSEAAGILRERAQHRESQPAWLRRLLKKVERK